MGFSVMLWGAEKLVPAEYWCPYGTWNISWTKKKEIWSGLIKPITTNIMQTCTKSMEIMYKAWYSEG